MRCHEIQERLNCLTVAERAADADVVAHLEQCQGCCQFAEALEKFDERVAGQLNSLPVPAGLADRLIEAMQAEVDQNSSPVASIPLAAVNASSVDIHESASATARWNVKRFVMQASTVAVAIAIIFMVSRVFVPEPVVGTLDYSVAKAELRELLQGADEASWRQFDSFDRVQFTTERLDIAVRNWSLSEPVGIDLGLDEAHDAAAFRFAYQPEGRSGWQGTLVVLPTEKFEATPTELFPSPSSGRQVLEWQSEDGQLTYLCYVESGSAEALAKSMFGTIS